MTDERKLLKLFVTQAFHSDIRQKLWSLNPAGITGSLKIQVIQPNDFLFTCFVSYDKWDLMKTPKHLMLEMWNFCQEMGY